MGIYYTTIYALLFYFYGPTPRLLYPPLPSSLYPLEGIEGGKPPKKI
jgi:hypothetical protein